VGSAAGDAGLYDLCAAAGAWLAGVGEDFELVLEFACLSEGVVVGVEGGAAGFDGAAQDVAGGCVDFCYLVVCQGVGPACGVDAGGVKDFVDVDVAEAGHYRLVEEQTLYVRFAIEGGGQVLDGEFVGEGVGAEA
jgi:hypothetical protein